MNEALETDQAAAMMAIVEEVAAGSQGLIRDWQLLPNAQQALRESGPEGLARFYRDCIERPGARETWIKATLEAHGRKTLESEYRRFMAAVSRPGLGRTEIDDRGTPARGDAESVSDTGCSSARTKRAFSNGLTSHAWGHADIGMVLITAAHRPFLPTRSRCGTVGVRVW